MSKSRHNKFIDTIDECLTNGVKNGIFQVPIEDDYIQGRNVTIDGKMVTSFGSCSYLGLEIDERLKQGAIDATIKFGTQYSSSRLFSECKLYEELESLMYKMFSNPVIVAPTTTLAHMAALPILVEDDHAIILDHQVHGSVQNSVKIVKSRGVHVDMIKHNDLNALEDKIKGFRNKYEKIWYMADGLYSMYGDYAPLKEIEFLLNKYAQLHLYIDDAHGMSWAGKHGRGYVLSQVELHPKMVLSTSMAKAYGTGGGILVFPNEEMKRKIKTCGSAFTYSGPIQPPMLGASIASAKIHVSDEIYELQNELREKINYTKSVIEGFKLPLVLPSDSPIFYIALGLPRVGYKMVKKLMEEGFYTNIGIFPGVPVKCAGLRLAINKNHSMEEIYNVLDAYSYHFPKVMQEEGQNIEDINSYFNMNFRETSNYFDIRIKPEKESRMLKIQHEQSITKIDNILWDDLLGENGTFDWEGCKFLEENYSGNTEAENNWKFHYVIIRDNNNTPLLCTFFTELLCKDDMISAAAISKDIEEIRKNDKYYLTSKVVMMGSLLSVGQHLYIKRDHILWQNAMVELIRIMNEVKKHCGASMIQLRDISSSDNVIRDFLIREGFAKVDMPVSHTINNLDWQDEADYLKRLSTKARWHLRRNIIDKKDLYSVNVVNNSDEITHEQRKKWEELYTNVKNKSFNINTYSLPFKYFELVHKHPNWEVIELKTKGENSEKYDTLIAVAFCYKSSKNNYSIMAVGLDYNYLLSHECYRQSLFQSVIRARALNCNKMYLGMDASIEKRKFGVVVAEESNYIQADDNFNMELIGTAFNVYKKSVSNK